GVTACEIGLGDREVLAQTPQLEAVVLIAGSDRLHLGAEFLRVLFGSLASQRQFGGGIVRLSPPLRFRRSKPRGFFRLPRGFCGGHARLRLALPMLPRISERQACLRERLFAFGEGGAKLGYLLAQTLIVIAALARSLDVGARILGNLGELF